MPAIRWKFAERALGELGLADGAVVFDPWNGSGRTSAACERAFEHRRDDQQDRKGAGARAPVAKTTSGVPRVASGALLQALACRALD